MHRKALNVYFLIPALLFLAACGFIALTVPQGETELWINGRALAAADFFFLHATEAGHGLFFAAVVAIFLFVHIGYAAALTLGGLLCSVVSNTMKHAVYTDAPRPPRFFEGLDLHHVEGSEILYHNSFPSGHTMTAFALFFMLSQLVRKQAWGLLLALAAVAVGLSRVYLLKHFFLDVCIGGFIGLAIGLFVHFVVMPAAQKWNYRLTRRGIRRLDT